MNRIQILLANLERHFQNMEDRIDLVDDDDWRELKGILDKKGIVPAPDHMAIPMLNEGQTLPDSEVDPVLKEWMDQCPAGYLLTKYKEEGCQLPTFRIGQQYSDEKDEYKRIPFNRLRLRMEVSAARFGLECPEEEIGLCECEKPVRGPERNGNPDRFYCVTCKKLFGRDQLPPEEQLI